MKIEKKALINNIILVAGFAVLSIGLLCIGGIIGIFGIIGIVCVIMYPVFAVLQTIKEKKEKFCNKCGTQYNYETDVSYKLLNRKLVSLKYTVTERNPDPAVKQLYYIMQFDCLCGCGERKTYNKKVYGGTYYLSGACEEKDVTTAIENYYNEDGLEVNRIGNYKWTPIIGYATAVLGVLLIFIGIIL